MREYTITDNDIDDLKSRCEDFDFWEKSTVEQWIRDLKKKQGLVTKINHQEVVNSFNTICCMLPKVEKLTDGRKSALSARIKEHSLESTIHVFNLTAESHYLTGKIKNWNATFDWIINPNNFVKILEGNYKNVIVATPEKAEFHKNS